MIGGKGAGQTETGTDRQRSEGGGANTQCNKKTEGCIHDRYSDRPNTVIPVGEDSY
jgi:hypothetical protein